MRIRPEKVAHLMRREVAGILQQKLRDPRASAMVSVTDVEVTQDLSFAKIYVRSKTGGLVPLSSVSSVERKVGPISINHTGQLQAITVSFNLAQGQALGDAAKKIERDRQQIGMPASVLVGWGGDAAAFQSSSVIPSPVCVVFISRPM